MVRFEYWYWFRMLMVFLVLFFCLGLLLMFIRVVFSARLLKSNQLGVHKEQHGPILVAPQELVLLVVLEALVLLVDWEGWVHQI